MIKRQFDYEDKYQKLQEKMQELLDLSETMQLDLSNEVDILNSKMEQIREDKYLNLTPWEKVLLSRHIERPTSRDYIETLCDEWIELHGDRYFGDDPAIIGGIAEFNGMAVTVIGHQKGKDTKDQLLHNFGMPNPEGYRKVERLLRQAEKFKRPVICFIDTPGAYPGIGAEERGQAWAIAQVLMTMSALKIPVISVVIGEGGSGGALALGVADRMLMLSNAVFSVASPEACASILWKDLDRVEEMANVLKITASDLMDLGIADEIIGEPVGGAHLDFTATAERLRKSLQINLAFLIGQNPITLVEQRYEKVRKITRLNE
ncbi:MAG: acetyl-coenzyme carboxylase carboxyl transferase subunit alpha [Firmicutes bacterium]|nr:acetyl-coenzyme carboxylase carboxyl transferase subunit alpha [Bacillota bacterium]